MAKEMNEDLDLQSAQLLHQLIKLQRSLRADTKRRFQRINPFCEDLFNWQERGNFWTQHDSVTIYNSATLVGDVAIGEHSWIGPYCALDGTGKLKIGQYCSISQGCQLLSHDSVKWALSGGKQGYEYSETSIGDNCFLGAYAVVLKGVTIGRSCIVAAGAVVTKDIPEFSIVAGVPAKLIGKVNVLKNGDIDLQYFEHD